ncbi:MAG TPA: class I lanthipeptide [Thermoanaerobaculia bacterium]|nr:class I lanthipeptide [Thermoanaerobaculia bacterium]
MKNRRTKKLLLNRETLRYLDAAALGKVAGGVTTTCPQTVSCDGSCSPTCFDTCHPRQCGP